MQENWELDRNYWLLSKIIQKIYIYIYIELVGADQYCCLLFGDHNMVD